MQTLHPGFGHAPLEEILKIRAGNLGCKLCILGSGMHFGRKFLKSVQGNLGTGWSLGTESRDGV